MANLNAKNQFAAAVKWWLKALFVAGLLAVAAVSSYKSYTREPVLELPYLKLTGSNGPELACIDGVKYFKDGTLPHGALLQPDGGAKTCAGSGTLQQFGSRYRLACYEGITLVTMFAHRMKSAFILYDHNTRLPKACT